MIHKFESLIRNIKIREQMLLIYLIGGIIPMLGVIFYNNQVTKHILIKQTMESEVAELSLLKDAVADTMRVVGDVSKRMYFDNSIEKVAFTHYQTYQEILDDYNDCTSISGFLNDYYQEIASISVYVNNETIASNANFIYASEQIRSEEWYKKTIEAHGNAYWSYVNNTITKKKSLRLTRELFTENMNKVGVLCIVLQNKRSELAVSERQNKTALIYNNEEIVHANFEEKNYLELLNLVKKSNKDEYYSKVTYKGKECFMAAVRIQPDYSDDYYTIVSIESYTEIVKGVNKNSIRECLPFLVCIGATFFLITIFSNYFSNQVNRFREQMHKAASGDFDIAAKIGGKDEISMLYEDLNKMIQDIQKLMANVVEEKIQREKIYSRQKEVEFKMLASQINPHFLYNTLETIRMKALVNKQKEIADLAKMLAKIMRRNIQVGDSLVTLESEVQLVEYYLKIQYYRFSDRIHSEIKVDENVDMNVMIMPLIIQPLVENAFVHGLESRESDGLLQILVSQEEGILYIRVKDNGCGISPEKLMKLEEYLNDFDNLDKAHIGISNVNQRIKLQYGIKYGLDMKSIEGEGTVVTLTMPVVKEENT